MLDLNSLILLGVSLAMLVVLLRPTLLRYPNWRATVTPLASIIGSGFLVIAPLLHGLAGRWSLLAVAVLVVLAYATGSVIRANIAYESLTQINAFTRRLDRLSSMVLGVAYVISVAFYVALLAAFLLNAMGLKTPETIRWAATAVLLALAFFGWLRGLDGYENLEVVSVSIKLAIISGILVSLAAFGIANDVPYFQHDAIVTGTLLERAQILGGLLMVAQGFETSRYLGHAYDTNTRIRTMRNAQLLSSGIYMAFIALTCPLFFLYPVEQMDETSVSLVLGNVMILAPMLLLVAAVSSQFSAAIADIVGANGLIRETAGKALNARAGYLIVIGVSLALIWALDIFEIITWASRGFAAYYALQTGLLLVLNHRQRRGVQRAGLALALMGLLGVLLFIVVGSKPPH